MKRKFSKEEAKWNRIVLYVILIALTITAFGIVVGYYESLLTLPLWVYVLYKLLRGQIEYDFIKHDNQKEVVISEEKESDIYANCSNY